MKKEIEVWIKQAYRDYASAKHSDVDLLLVSKNFRRQRKLKRSTELYLKWDLDYPVDFLCLTPEEFSKQKKMIGIVKEAVEKGIKII